MSVILQAIVVFGVIAIGARYAGIGLGIWGGIGLFLLVTVFGLTPTSAPTDVLLIMIAVAVTPANSFFNFLFIRSSCSFRLSAVQRYRAGEHRSRTCLSSLFRAADASSCRTHSFSCVERPASSFPSLTQKAYMSIIFFILW